MAQLSHSEDNAELVAAFDTIDLVLTFFFLAELLVNMVAFWFWHFWGNGWYLFDTVIVILSLLDISQSNMPAVKHVRVLRIFRVLRVFRAFGRLERLKILITALIASIVPWAQALVILLIVASIYCTIGVELYRGDAPQEFGDFTRAFYTLFGVVAYGKWPEDRIPGFGEDGKLNVVNIVYIYSFVVVVVLVLIQVLVAVLLDNFFRASREQQEHAAAEMMERERQLDNILSQKERYHLDFFMEYLARNFRTEDDAIERIDRLFRFLDVDRSGEIEYLELSQGLFRLQKARAAEGTEIHRMTEEEYHHVTEGLLSEGQQLTKESFRSLLLRRLRLYVQRKAADAIKYHLEDESHADMEAVLVCFKYFLMSEHTHTGDEKAAGALGGAFTPPLLQPSFTSQEEGAGGSGSRAAVQGLQIPGLRVPADLKPTKTGREGGYGVGDVDGEWREGDRREAASCGGGGGTEPLLIALMSSHIDAIHQLLEALAHQRSTPSLSRQLQQLEAAVAKARACRGGGTPPSTPLSSSHLSQRSEFSGEPDAHVCSRVGAVPLPCDVITVGSCPRRLLAESQGKVQGPVSRTTPPPPPDPPRPSPAETEAWNGTSNGFVGVKGRVSTDDSLAGVQFV